MSDAGGPPAPPEPAAAARPWVVILAHGARDARWREPFEALRRELAAGHPELGVALAYLQFCPPSLEQTLADLARRGARHVVVVPAFMSGGGHLMRDVPGAVERAAAAAPALTVEVSGALGEEPEVMRAMHEAVARLATARR